MICVDSLNKKYKRHKSEPGFVNAVKNFFNRNHEYVHSLRDVSFEIGEGEIVGLIGHNGAGKSTLIKLLTGVIRPSSGTLQVLGSTPSVHNNGFKKKIGVVLGKKSQLWWDLSPEETYLLHKKFYDINDDDYKALKGELYERLNVAHVVNSPARTLSLGERMKCELICSLLHQPQILFLDEPTIGLDFESQKNIRLFLKDFVEKHRTTIVLTSHYSSDIEELCEHLLVLNEGKLAFDGDSKTMRLENGVKMNISLTFSQVVAKEKLECYGQVTDYRSTEATIRVAKDQYHKIVAEIMDLFTVLDFKVIEDDISYAIKTLLAR